jgi:hypothetical protein
VVVQNKPLCNIGLTMKGLLETFISQIFAIWLMITEMLQMTIAAVVDPTSLLSHKVFLFIDS